MPNIDRENKWYIECYKMCKNLLINETILKYPDFNKEFHLTTDGSDYAMGRCSFKSGGWMQDGSDGRRLGQHNT